MVNPALKTTVSDLPRQGLHALLAAALLTLPLGAALGKSLHVGRPSVPASSDTRNNTHGFAARGLLSLPLAARGPVSDAVGADSPAYRFVQARNDLIRATTPAQRLGSSFTSAGVSVRSGTTRVAFSLRGVGYGDASELTALAPTTPTIRQGRVLYAHRGLTEWYANGPLGLEQGFTIARPPARHAAGPLMLSLALTGNAHPTLTADGQSITLSRGGRTVLRYTGLSASDATGRALSSWLTLEGGRVVLRVNLRAARYPVRIDPFIQQGSKLTANDETGQGMFGDSVALSSDGNTALIGGVEDYSFYWAAWVFTRSGSTWTQQGSELTANDETEEGGFLDSVALSSDGSTALMGGAGDHLDVGAAWVFTGSTEVEHPGGGGAPQVQTLPATDVTTTGVMLHGSLNPNGVAVTDCHFDLGTTTSYGQTVGCNPSYVGSGTSSAAISAAIGVDPGTTYHYRLVATNTNGTANGQDMTFTTGTCGTGTPTICSVLPDNGPVLGGTQIFVQGTGFQPGDQLCFYVAPRFSAPVACASKSQTTVYNSTSMQAVTPSLVNSAAVGKYYLGVQRCCSYSPSVHTSVTSDYVSDTTYLYFPPPPLVEPSSCQIFSIGENACWRVGFGVVRSGLFNPGRPPDYLLISAGLGVGPVEGGDAAAVTCSGDLWVGESASLSLGPGGSVLNLEGVPIYGILAQAYVGLPTDTNRTYADVDGFISGFTGNIGGGIVGGINLVLTAQAPGPTWAVEYWVSSNFGSAVGGSLSEYVLGPDPYSQGFVPQALRPKVQGTTCGDVYTTPTFQALLQASVAAVGVSGGSAAVAVPCTSAGGCSGSASISSGSGSGAAAASRVPKRSAATGRLGAARFSIPAHMAGLVHVQLSRAAMRHLGTAGGRLKALLTLNETMGGHHYHHTRLITIELAPRLTDLRQAASAWREPRSRKHRVRVGTTFTFTLNESCEVGLTFTTNQHGRTVNLGQVVIAAHRGRNAIRFRGAISAKTRLAPGTYTVYVIAANTASQRSVPRRLAFTILR